MSIPCPGCRAWMTPRRIACPRCMPMVPVSIRETLVRLYLQGITSDRDTRWKEARDAARNSLRKLAPPRPPRAKRGEAIL